MSAGSYVNPLQLAHVTPERIDQGVDYAGTGQYVALGAGTITEASSSGTGWPGGFIEEKLAAGPLAGQSVYYAEGVRPRVRAGQQVAAGQPVADLIPGWHSGTELGFGSGQGSSTYASSHGGYREGQLTAAGKAFSDLIKSLGGPAGLTEGRSPVGSAPSGVADSGSGILGTGIGPNIGPDLNPVDAIKSVFTDFLNWLKGQLAKGALYGALIAGGAGLAAYGLVKALEPTGLPRAAKTAVKTAAAAKGEGAGAAA